MYIATEYLQTIPIALVPHNKHLISEWKLSIKLLVSNVEGMVSDSVINEDTWMPLCIRTGRIVTAVHNSIHRRLLLVSEVAKEGEDYKPSKNRC